MERKDLAERLELVGGLFEIDGMSELLAKFDVGEDEKGNRKQLNPVKFNSIIIQIESLLMKTNPDLGDRIIEICGGVPAGEINKMEDSEYAAKLKEAIIRDVLGFFASSPRSDGQK